MTGPLIPKKKKKPPVEYQEWAVLRDEWIVGQLIGGVRAMTLTDFAISKNLSVQTVQNRSSTMKWRAELDLRRKANDDVVTKALAERSESAIEEIKTIFVGHEATIRKRHAQISQGLQAKAMQRLASIDPKTLSVKEAIAMLQLGLTEERFALGMKEMYVPSQDHGSSNTEYKSLVQQQPEHKKIVEMAATMLKRLREKGVSEAVILKEVGLPQPASSASTPSSSTSGGRG